MASIADSDAFFDPDRLLAQHQAALSVLQGFLGDPALASVFWLDLASGRGQIIANLDENVSETMWSKIHYVGYDIENAHSRLAEKTAAAMGLASSHFEIGALSRFSELLPPEKKYNFITLTNTVHEILPRELPAILCECIGRLSDDGCLFVYDMERLPAPELGAVLWSAKEVKLILSTLFDALGCEHYEPQSDEVWA